MKKIVVLTGAGISAESGIRTFRDAGGLWEGHRVQDVATPAAWRKNPDLVRKFYNDRRRQLHIVKPNEAHLSLKDLESAYDVHIITQNVDNLHEQAKSSQIIHLHGELMKARSSVNDHHIVEWVDDINADDLCPSGSCLRPHIVWFGEAVPMMDVAIRTISTADYVWIIGTSMQVYPAASLVSFAPKDAEFTYVDPAPKLNYELGMLNVRVIENTAAKSIPSLVNTMLK